jgi:hypothetical protein
VSVAIVIGLALAALSTVLINVAYLREHDAAAELPALSMRRPLHSARILLSDRSWLVGFATETAGFLLYAAALRFAPLTLVQTISAGGIGVLAFVSARLDRRPLGRRELRGVVLSVVGLAALAGALSGGAGAGGRGSTVAIVVWLAATAAAALAVLAVGRRRGTVAVAYGIAGGLFFSIGDISTKVATEGGVRAAFVVALIVGYTLGTSLLQIGYQSGAALTVAGLATLLTNALPIVAGVTVLHEGLPAGPLAGVQVLAFAAVTLGAVLLARPGSRG